MEGNFIPILRLDFKHRKMSKLYLLVIIALLAVGCSSQGNRSKNAKEGTLFYTSDDFTKVRKIDMHYHFNTTDSLILQLFRDYNFRVLDIVDDRPFGVPMNELQKIAIYLNGTFPDKIAFASTFSVKSWNDKNWESQTVSYLDTCISKGAKAVKIWKNIGMDLRDKNGKFVMVDDARLDTVLDFLASKKVTLIGHNGEPRDCWLPIDSMEVNGNRNYYSQHPEYHMYLHPEYPSYENQIRARDNMLAKHPDLKFVGCHLGSLEWSLDELAKRLDDYPNMAVDVSRMANLLIHATRNWQMTHDFFINYQDRLIYGTDRSVNSTDNPDDMKKNIHNSWMRDWKFFATDEIINNSEVGGEIKGLKLPASVIDKLYRENAEKWIPGI
jgi:hypothetical protein